jgi:hypothetical protein
VVRRQERGEASESKLSKGGKEEPYAMKCIVKVRSPQEPTMPIVAL